MTETEEDDEREEKRKRVSRRRRGVRLRRDRLGNREEKRKSEWRGAKRSLGRSESREVKRKYE